MKKDDADGLHVLLESMHAMKQRQPKLPRGRDYKAHSLPKPSTLVTRFKMDGDGPRAETIVQQLQERNGQLMQQIASKDAQSNDLHNCITALNKELRLTVDQLNQFKQANAEKDHEISTLRAHVDDLYQVQLQLRSESLQYKVELKKRPSQTVSEVAAAVESPLKNEMACGIGETLDCLQREMAALEAQVEKQEPTFNAADSIEEWYQMLNTTGEEISSYEDKVHFITKSLKQVLEKATVAAHLQHTLELSEKQCRDFCHELRLLQMQSELQSCYWVSDALVDDDKTKALQDKLHELITENAHLSKTAAASVAKCKLWETQYNAIQIELEKVGERWEAAQAAMDEEREAMETKLFNTCVHAEQLEILLSDFQSTDEVELIDQFTQCDASTIPGIPSEYASPIKATSQWISVIDAMQANHDVEMEVLRNDIAIAERQILDKDAEIEQLQYALESTNGALGELHIRQDLIAHPIDEWVNFAETTGGRLISLVCDDFIFVNSSCQTDAIQPIGECGESLVTQELITKLELQAKQIDDLNGNFKAATQRERQLQNGLQKINDELIAANSTIAAKNQELTLLGSDIDEYKKQLQHLRDCCLADLGNVHEMNQMENEDKCTQLLQAKNRIISISQDVDQLKMELSLKAIAYNSLDSQHCKLLHDLEEENQRNQKLAMKVEDCLGYLCRCDLREDAIVPKAEFQFQDKATITDDGTEDDSIKLTDVEIIMNNSEYEDVTSIRAQMIELMLLAGEDRRSQFQVAEEKWNLEKTRIVQKYTCEIAQLQRTVDDTKQTLLAQCDAFQQLVSRQEQCIQSMKEEKLVLSRHFESKAVELSEIVGPAKLPDGDALGTKLGHYHSLVSKLLIRYHECHNRLLLSQTNQDGPEEDSSIPVETNNNIAQHTECHADTPLKLPKNLIDMSMQTLPTTDDVIEESFEDIVVLGKELENENEISDFVPKFQALVSKFAAFKQGNDKTILQVLIRVLEATNKALDQLEPEIAPCKEKALEIRCWDVTESVASKAIGTLVEPQGCVIVIIGAFEIQAGIVRKQPQSIPDLRLPTSAVIRSGHPLFEHGVLVNFSAYEQVLQQIFELLHIQPSMYKLILLHKPSISPLEKERLVTMALESCCVPSVNLTTHAQASILSKNIHTGLVLDFGVDTIYIVPIYEDMVLDHAVVKVDIANSIAWHNPSDEKQSIDRLLHPNGSKNLINAILKSLVLCDAEIHASLLQDVVLTGGCTHEPTLSHHMTIELRELISAIDTIPSTTIPHVHIVANIYYGANVHATLVSSFKWISHHDYQVEGASIVHTRCF